MKTVNLRGGGEVQTCSARPGGKEWLVSCSKESAERIRVWEEEPVKKGLLSALSGIPHILVPRKLLPGDPPHYIANPPLGIEDRFCREKEWFCAGELQDLRTLHQQGMTVGTLWQAAASLCDTLEKLLSLEIWGGADRGAVLLRSDGAVCLTGVTDFHAYQIPQFFRQKQFKGEEPKTTALRTLLGGLAFCMDEPARECDEEDSALEVQLGRTCTEALSALFRTPSELPPNRFLEEAKDCLLSAARYLRQGKPRQLRLYLVLLGGDCRQMEIPALSSAARCFRRCVEELREEGFSSPVSTVLIYPWDGVELCELAPEVIPGISALPSGEPRERMVLLGGLLDSLDRELERNLEEGGAALVCYIDLPAFEGGKTTLQLNCMERYLLKKLGRKRKLGVIDALLCGNDLRMPPHWLSSYIDANIVTAPAALEREMHQAIIELLKAPYYSLEIPESED